MALINSRRSSGTATRPTFGSIVVKGKFAASAAAVAVRALNSDDLPTLGSPTMPQLNPIRSPHSGELYARGHLVPGPGLGRVQRQRDLAHEGRPITPGQMRKVIGNGIQQRLKPCRIRLGEILEDMADD